MFIRFYTYVLGSMLVLVMLSLLTGCAAGNQSYNPNKKFGPDELKQDFDVVWKTYQQNHPSLYWYSPKDTVDKAFNDVYAGLTDSLTELEFRNRLAAATEKIKCGHTSVRMSKSFAKYSAKQHNEPSFPLSMKTWGGDSLVVTRNAFRRDSQLVRGTIIQSINGMPVKDIINRMGLYISPDGYNNNFKYQIISNNFPIYYRFAFGVSKYYDITYTAIDGSMQTKRLQNYFPKLDTLDKKSRAEQPPVHRPSKKQIRKFELLSNRSLTIDTANHLAYMMLNTFSKNKLNKFFRQSFRTLKKQHIPNLVIELRDNGGGSISKSNRLTRYLVNHPFKVADTAKAISFKYPYPQYVQKGFWYKVEHWLVSAKRRKDGYFHFNQLETKVYKPFTKNHYDGHVYIVTGGFTFSASTLFIRPLKGQSNVTIVGEETGGGAYGNTAVNIPDLILPNTHIRMRLPLYRLVLDKNLPHNGRGILPDVVVPPGSEFLKNNIDPKMEKIKQLIKNSNQPIIP